MANESLDFALFDFTPDTGGSGAHLIPLMLFIWVISIIPNSY
jgi:hypothetical protein